LLESYYINGDVAGPISPRVVVEVYLEAVKEWREVCRGNVVLEGVDHMSSKLFEPGGRCVCEGIPVGIMPLDYDDSAGSIVDHHSSVSQTLLCVVRNGPEEIVVGNGEAG